jgi:hypothetical protein
VMPPMRSAARGSSGLKRSVWNPLTAAMPLRVTASAAWLFARTRSARRQDTSGKAEASRKSVGRTVPGSREIGRKHNRRLVFLSALISSAAPATVQMGATPATASKTMIMEPYAVLCTIKSPATAMKALV